MPACPVNAAKKQNTMLTETDSYIIITPVRNEEKYVEKTLQAVTAQTVAPQQWIVVDDGSTDRTGAIIDAWAGRYGWITPVHLPDRGYTAVGRGIIDAFYAGYNRILRPDSWQFLVKLDGDISIDADYFASLLDRFRKEERLGIAGGTCYCLSGGMVHEEKTPAFHPIAAARMYRRSCFEEIGGLAFSNAWDTIDLLRARTRGWRTRRFSELLVFHYRIMSSRQGLWQGKLRTGRNLYLTGYSVPFLLARSLYRLFRKPYLLESMAVICGYFMAMFRGEPLAVTSEEREFLHREQRQRLLGFNR
ncbi:MAG TPA: glycosyltransferase family 2 protein [Desulfobulbus sp.]|nr:glycosyltransferase family 2 protein [Desulfobulbus sp.]